MAAPSSPAIDLSSGLLLAALALVWGGSFFFAEVALRELPPLTITLFRVALALPVLFLVVRLKGIAIPRGATRPRFVLKDFRGVIIRQFRPTG